MVRMSLISQEGLGSLAVYRALAPIRAGDESGFQPYARIFGSAFLGRCPRL